MSQHYPTPKPNTPAPTTQSAASEPVANSASVPKKKTSKPRSGPWTPSAADTPENRAARKWKETHPEGTKTQFLEWFHGLSAEEQQAFRKTRGKKAVTTRHQRLDFNRCTLQNRANLQYVFDYARALDGGTQYHIHYMFAHGTTLNGWHTS
ncbi:hypothetical protein CPB85DRAFT_1442359 [Mucidula mucida]|nr:hypothetical protein CPB85DRAFT_1442359 [Mucidula mucida]